MRAAEVRTIRKNLLFRGVQQRVGWIGVVTLGAATGVLMAVLVLADRLYLSPLGSTRVDSAIAVFAAHLDTGRPRELTSYASFTEWRQRSTSFTVLSGYRPTFVNIVGQPQPERLPGAQVASEFFDAIGARLPFGRTFDHDDYVGAGLVCVISDTLWRRRFDANPAIVGTSVRLEIGAGIASGEFTIVGIAPPGFRYPDRTDIWVPYIPSEFFSRNHSGQWFAVIGQLRSGVTLDQANAELTSVMQEVQTAYPRMQPAHVANIMSLREVLTADRRTLVSALVLASMLLWLSAGASVGSLLAARSLETRQEDAIRLSLGAPWSTLVVDAFKEGVLLGVTGFLVALPLSIGVLRLFRTISIAALETAADINLTAYVAAIGLVILIFTYSAVLLAMKLQSLRRIANAGVRVWTSGRIAGVAHMRMRAALVVIEIAFTVVAMILAAGVLARLDSIQNVDLGFVPDELLTVRLELPTTRYNDTQAVQFFDAAMQQVRGMPNITGVAGASDEPLFGQSANPEFTLQLENRPLAPDERTPVLVNGITREYFSLLQIPIVEGNADALDSSELTALVNRSFAQRFYAGQTPMGRRFRFGGNNPPWWTIVGVVADTRNDGPLLPAKPTVYMNGKGFNKRGMTLLAKASGDAHTSVSAIRGALAGLDPDLPIGPITPATALIQRRFADVWIAARCLAAVSAAALLLAAIGLIGVLTALAVELRPEIALRTALGANPLNIAAWLYRRTGHLTLLGLAIGTSAGLAAARLVAANVGFDPPRAVHVLIIGGIVLSIAAAASIGPIVGATRADPADALRSQ